MESLNNRPSCLILAPKRSGTNFAHDVAAISFPVAVNEPLGLHNDMPGEKKNPLDPWSFSSNEHVSQEFGHTGLKEDPYGNLLARSFLDWLRQGNKLIKETDFLYLGWLLGSVPLKIVTIQRDPRDSIASFKKHDLFERWGMQEKMNRFVETMTQTPALDTLYGGLSQFGNTTKRPPHQQLAIYYSVALLEIARNTKGQETLKTTYADLVNAPIPTFQKIMAFINSPWSEKTAQAVIERTTSMRDPGEFGTFRRPSDLTTFAQILSPKETEEISSICLDFGIELPHENNVFVASLHQKEKAERKLGITPIQSVRRSDEISVAKKETIQVDLQKPLYVSKTLVTNTEYARFLQWLVDNDIPLMVNGKPLFYNDRPQGNIRRDGSHIFVEDRMDSHPVNFVNWIGAASYCAWIGGRLPSDDEWEKAICPKETQAFRVNEKTDPNRTNTSQVYGGTTPVKLFPPNSEGIYDAFGNTSIWLSKEDCDKPYERLKAGPEWNHTAERGVFPNPRPYWLGTSGLGIRPVFDPLAHPMSDSTYLLEMQEILEYLTSTHHPDTTLANNELFNKFDILFAYNK